MPRPSFVLALGAALLLAAPAGAAATGFGPTTPLTQSPPQTPQPVVASVFSNSKLRVTRFFPVGPASTVDVATPVGNIGMNLHVASNPRGDALVTWTENGGGEHVAVALFWPAGQQAPNEAHELLSGGTATRSGPWSVLDPDGSATVVWYDAMIRQVTTQNAGAADPWGEPTADLGRGGGVGAQLPDGRAVYGITEEVQVTSPTPGHTRFWRIHATTRQEGHPFRPPADLAGGSGGAPASVPERFPTERLPAVAISPAGRALVAYITTKNGDDDSVCDPYEREVHAALGSVGAGTGPPSFSSSLVSTADPDPYELTGARAGTDDRLAVVWHEQLGCWNESGRPQRHVAAYTTPGHTGMTPTGPGVPGPPATLRGFWWLADGRLLFWTETSSPFADSQTIFDTGVPVTGAPDDPDPGGGGSAPVVPISAPSGGGGGTPPIPTVARVKSKYKASPNGTVRVTVTVPSPGDLAIELLAKRSGLIAAKKTLRVRRYKRKVTKAGSVKLTLKLTGRAKRTLKRRHKLKVTVVTTFKPSGGGKSLRSTKSVTFKQKG